MTDQRRYDHLVLDAHDLEKARDTYRKLGFTLTPIAVHPFGTHNSLVQFRDTFLELLSVNNASLIAEHSAGEFSFGAFNRGYLEVSEGLAQIVFYGADSRRDAQEFAEKGLADYAPFDFSRVAKLPDGSEVTVSFSLAFVTHEDMPYASFFSCHQHSPEYFWKQQYQTHPNSALGIVETMMVADEPEKYQGFFESLINSQSVAGEGKTHTFATNGGQFCVMTPEQWEKRFPGEKSPDMTKGPRMAGYGLKVASLAKATQCFDENSIEHTSLANGVFIPGEIGHGSLIYFSE